MAGAIYNTLYFMELREAKNETWIKVSALPRGEVAVGGARTGAGSNVSSMGLGLLCTRQIGHV